MILSYFNGIMMLLRFPRMHVEAETNSSKDLTGKKKSPPRIDFCIVIAHYPKPLNNGTKKSALLLCSYCMKLGFREATSGDLRVYYIHCGCIREKRARKVAA